MKNLTDEERTLTKDILTRREKRRRANALADECIRASIREGLIDARDFDMLTEPTATTPIWRWDFETEIGAE